MKGRTSSDIMVRRLLRRAAGAAASDTYTNGAHMARFKEFRRSLGEEQVESRSSLGDEHTGSMTYLGDERKESRTHLGDDGRE